MIQAKRIILILLLLALLAGAILSDPLLRFMVDLTTQRLDNAQAVYLSRLDTSDVLRTEACEQLGRYADHLYSRYAQRKLNYDGIMDILTPLSQTALPQKDIERCLMAVNEMESARADLLQADGSASKQDYAQAIPLYRRSLIADVHARDRLDQAESRYLDQLLEQALQAMDAADYDTAESILMKGQEVLGDSDDLSDALDDVRRMASDQTFAGYEAEARRLLTEKGPEASFRYVAALRQQAPEEYRLEYIEQLVRHEYEEDICARAASLQDAGDALGACALLEEGSLWIVSPRIEALHAQIKATFPYPLYSIPVMRDQTSSPRTGADNTLTWDRYLQDSSSNSYEHSLYADIGIVYFSLEGEFSLFEGTVAFPQGEWADIYQASATLQVYGDDRLIAEFKEMDDASAPIPFSIPVEGVRELGLVWTSAGAGGWKDWGRFATVFDGRLLSAAVGQ